MRQGTKWTPQRLAWTALLMSFDEGQTISARFEHAAQLGRELHAHWRLGESYGGFTKALVAASPTLVPGLVKRFQNMMRQRAAAHWLCRRWQAFAVDGTRIETPHTAANDALGCAGKEKSAPQVYLTSLWHLGLGLPWDFRTGRGVDSERRQLEDMLGGLPERSLVVGDAGFCGYESCRRILEAGHSFLLRVGSNITLLTELGWHFEEREGLVCLWPLAFRNQPPLVLRLIVLRRGKQTVYLLTNVLDAGDLSEEEASQLYELRWPALEVGYRSYKQTLDRRTLLSRTPATCLVEAQWTMLGLWLLGLLCVARQSPNDEPRRWSSAGARDAVRRAMRYSTHRPSRRRSRRLSLNEALRTARHDTYVRRRSKTARNYPHKKKEKPPGPPNIKPATPHEVRKAARLREKLKTAA